MYYWIADDGVNRAYMASDIQPPPLPIYTPITKEQFIALTDPALLDEQEEPTEQGGE